MSCRKATIRTFEVINYHIKDRIDITAKYYKTIAKYRYRNHYNVYFYENKANNLYIHWYIIKNSITIVEIGSIKHKLDYLQATKYMKLIINIMNNPLYN